ncbi:MAG: hypothetical protein ABIO94_00030 [Opitutaceae bacterium]
MDRNVNSFRGGARASQVLRIMLVVALAVHLASAAFHIFFGALNVDEGFYSLAARSVMEGEIPYRDFAYAQTPLLPYVNGPLLSVTGYGLFQQRAVNGLWAFLAIVIAGYLVARRTHVVYGILLASVFSTTPAWMYFVHLGKTYAFVCFAVMLATWVFLDLKAGWKKYWLLSFLGILGTGCRLPAAPFFAVLWLAAFWQNHSPSRRDFVVAGAGLGLFSAALLLPFSLLSPGGSRFWPFAFQLASVLERKWHVQWDDSFKLAPIWWIMLVVIPVLAGLKRRFDRSPEIMVGAAAIVALATNLLPVGAYEEYGVPFILPLACAVACTLHALTVNGVVFRRRLVLAVLAALHLTAPPLLTRYRGTARADLISNWLPSTVPGFDLGLPVSLARARNVVEQLLPKGSPFIGPNLILAVETGRPVPSNLRLGPFTMTRDFDTDKARQLHLMTYPELTSIFEDPAVPLVAFFPAAPFNYNWSVPSFRSQPEAERQQWAELFRRDFLVVETSSQFLLLGRRNAVLAAPFNQR